MDNLSKLNSNMQNRNFSNRGEYFSNPSNVKYKFLNVKDLGTQTVDPDEYRSKYTFDQPYYNIPFVDGIIEKGVQLRTQEEPYLPKLEGDVEALRLIDLWKEGLEGYHRIVFPELYENQEAKDINKAKQPPLAYSIKYPGSTKNY